MSKEKKLQFITLVIKLKAIDQACVYFLVLSHVAGHTWF